MKFIGIQKKISVKSVLDRKCYFLFGPMVAVLSILNCLLSGKQDVCVFQPSSVSLDFISCVQVRPRTIVRPETRNVTVVNKGVDED